MAQPFKKLAQFFKRIAPIVLTATGNPVAGAVVKGLEDAADARKAAEAAPAPSQTLQGSLTHAGIGVAAFAFLLQRYDLVPAGYSPEATAAVLTALGVAIYGRIRREWRP